MYPTMQLIELQTYFISKDKSMIDDYDNYKKTPEVLTMISELWNDADEDERKYIEKLVAGAKYSEINSK